MREDAKVYLQYTWTIFLLNWTTIYGQELNLDKNGKKGLKDYY